MARYQRPPKPSPWAPIGWMIVGGVVCLGLQVLLGFVLGLGLAVLA